MYIATEASSGAAYWRRSSLSASLIGGALPFQQDGSFPAESVFNSCSLQSRILQRALNQIKFRLTDAPKEFPTSLSVYKASKKCTAATFTVFNFMGSYFISNFIL